MRFEQRVIAVALGLVGLIAASARADEVEEAVAFDQVPAIVREAVVKATPDVNYTKASRITDDGATFFRFEGSNGDGRSVHVEASPKGKVLEVATEVQMSEVPDAVSSALLTHKKTRNMKVESRYAVAKNGVVVEYEFEGQNARGDDIVVTISANGRKVEVDED